ncbi:Site-specific recombinase XerD [Pseudobutyrivibrio ruminis]|uniref:Site-specific recombinase XerD n=1 Tax=Pseudobutyrivibrio ruminis TaxID=46206 RepID=A0A1H7F378_9FIRM|nr:site-specific integrase [Pseudobutyrivibrio ruminis]SEK18470.1 Site-specific recombinase XerD [Pseudobutyrivibrio ruminis]
MYELKLLNPDLQKRLQILSFKKNMLREEMKCGMIGFAEAAEQVANLKRQERKLIKEAVDAIHVKNNGEPRSIKLNEGKGLYYTSMPDKSQVYGKTLDSLYENLFHAYGLTIEKNPTTVEEVFKQAFERKVQTSTNKSNSLKRNLNTYNTYFSEDFTKRDITKITKEDLLAYTKSMCEEFHPSKKEFLAYKGILNLIFEYAFDTDIRIDNPVPCIHNEDYYKDGYCNCVTRESEDNIFSNKQIEDIRAFLKERNVTTKFKGYDINGYAITLSTFIGTRVGEICSLKWSDIKEYFIWIHSQMVEGERIAGQGMTWEYCPYTKNERKKSSKKGRYYPLTDDTRALLQEIKAKQVELGIYDEHGYIFIRTNNEPINPNSYTKSLKKMMDKLGYKVTNNHAFRKSVNSNILIPMGLDEVQRADLLGHSPEVNLNNYTYKRLDDSNEIYQRFNDKSNDNPKGLDWSRKNIVNFETHKKRKSL